MNEHDELVENKLQVEGDTGEAKPETSSEFKKYDVFGARIINAVFSATVTFIPLSLMIFIAEALNFVSDLLAIPIIILGIYVFRYTWRYLKAPGIKQSKAMKLWVYIKKQWKEFNHWIRTLGDDA